MTRNVEPSGFPRWRKVSDWLLSLSANDVLSRNSCVMAIPMDANANDVRSQARNVRSISSALVSSHQEHDGSYGDRLPNAK